MRLLVIGLLCFALTGCSGGAVIFAPTQPPPDVSALTYTHPGGVFTVNVPRNWSVYEQNTTALASAAFSPPNADAASVRFAVMNMGSKLDSAGLGAFMDRYQAQIRPDAKRYHEINRQAMGDGSWRLSGLRQTAGGETEQLNTFIQQTGNFIGLAEVTLPVDSVQRDDLQRVVNTFSINPNATLQSAEPDVLAYAGGSGLDVLHLATWTTPGGVFFITGEVANNGTTLITDLPVSAVLRTGDGLPVAESVDVVMGYGIPPGGFAPFSLRFGQGQPALTQTFELSLGGEDWTPDSSRIVYGQDDLTWTDNSEINAEGMLVITGNVTNIGTNLIRDLRAVATVFDADGNVIAAGFIDFAAGLNPGDASAFRLPVPEMGGQAVNYIVTIQGLP